MSGVEAVLGVVSAGAGLISLAIQLGESIQKLKPFRDKVKNSQTTLTDLIFDLEMGLCLDQLERHKSQDTTEAELVTRCLTRCCLAVNRVQVAVDKMQHFNNRFPRLSRFHTAFKDSDVTRLLVELDQAKSALSVSLLMFYSEQQNRRHNAQYDILKYQTTQLDLIWNQVHANSLAIARDSEHEARDTNAESASARQGLSRQDVWKMPEKQLGEITRRKAIRMSVRLPTWICSQVWKFSIMQANCGWNVRMTTSMVRDSKCEIFHHCAIGDVEVVRRLISQGHASLWDTTAYDHLSRGHVY